MKRIFLLIAILTFLYGCSISPPTSLQQQKAFDNEKHKTRYGETWTVNTLKEDYRAKTGMILVAPDAKSCGWDGSCYYNAWSSAHDNGISVFNAKKLEEKKIVDAKCLADKECKRSKDLLEARKGLSWGYTMLLGINPYSQAESDYLVRNICEKVTVSQKEGVGRAVLINKMRDFPGIAPRERGILTEIVGSCWDISKLSGDWRAAIRQH